ncbi:MAG TPA: SpoIIE family protein phosphatase [Candidatus Baltobacteraceae bacterium]|nr:SpoIIE family protein phosphatase [Candidatus Baltobacteraceae bacterium]
MAFEAAGEFDAATLRTFAQRLERVTLVLDSSAECVQINAAWTAFAGLEADRSLGNGWQLAIHPSDLPGALTAIEAGMRAEQPFELRYRLRSAHGDYATFAAACLPVRESSGALREWLVISDRADLEHAGDDRFWKLADALPVLVWATDRDDRLTFVNRAWLEYTGLGAGSTIDERNALVHPLDLPFLMRALRGGARAVDFRLRRRADGMYRWHYLRWEHLNAPPFPFYRIGTAMDVHDQRTATELRDRQLRAIAEALPDIVWSTDARGVQDYTNGALQRFTGLSEDECVGDVWQRFTHPLDWLVTRERWNEALITGNPYEIQHRLMRRDGSSRWFLSRARPMRNELGEIVRWFGTSTDIHDQKRLAQEQTYLAELGRIVNSSLELDRTLRHICEAAVPLLADSCQIDLLTNGVLRRAAAAHNGPQREVSAARIRENVFGGERASVFTERIDDSSFQTIVVPMRVRGKPIGAISFIRPHDSGEDGIANVGFLEEVARRCALAIQNAQLYQREHRVADALQTASLPKRLPEVDGIEMDAIYVPGRSEAQIGGDWYDAFVLPDGRIVVSIGDVAGSGLDAAVTMSNMRQVIRGIAQVHAEPVLMLNSADRALRMDDPDRFVTAFVGVIDPIASTMTYASAGHLPPYIRRRDGTLDELVFVDLPLGLRERFSIETCSVSVGDGDLLVFYTDGLVESSHNLEEGVRILRAALSDPQIDRAAHPAAFIRDSVLLDGARDDVAILTLRVHGDARLGNLRRWSFAALEPVGLARIRHELRAALIEYGVSELHLETAEVVLGELTGNVVRHAPGAVEIVLDHTAGKLVLHVIDEGPGFERAPMLPVDVMSESGRGLFIVSRLTGEFSITKRHPRGSHARAVLPK